MIIPNSKGVLVTNPIIIIDAKRKFPVHIIS